jgi:quercetin dioxygenase-like cupin family protein
MNSPPVVSVRPSYFRAKAEVLQEIARDDLWPVTVHQGGFAAAPLHCHDAPVRIYVFAGTLLVNGGRTRPAFDATVGTRVDIPAGAVHTVSADGPVVTITAFTSSAFAASLPQLPVPDDA